MRKWIVQGLTPILCGFALLLGVIAVGRMARAALHNRAAYSLSFADIDCQPPAGMERDDFLNEVRSLTHQPTEMHLLDKDLTGRLHRAFLAHPWVESVNCVAIAPPASAAKLVKPSVRVEMEYRQAVLTVPQTDGGRRLVDRYGTLLPGSGTQSHLPVLVTEVAAPPELTGSRWGDARVASAAKTAAFLQAHLAPLHLEECRMEVVEAEIILSGPGVRIVWGHAPGQEKEDEAPAKVKLRRLLEYQKEHDGLDRLEHDVRLVAYQGHFPLSPDERRYAVSLYGPSQSPALKERDKGSNSSGSWRSCFNESQPPSANTSSR